LVKIAAIILVDSFVKKWLIIQKLAQVQFINITLMRAKWSLTSTAASLQIKVATL
jgi:hypothetical protein